MSESTMLSQVRLHMIRKLRSCQFRDGVECPFCAKAINDFEAVVRGDERRKVEAAEPSHA